MASCSPMRSGRLYSPERPSRDLQTAAIEAGLPAIGSHGLRRTLPTIAQELVVALKLVSDRPGHASVATTLDIHTLTTTKQDRAVARALADALVGPVEAE